MRSFRAKLLQSLLLLGFAPFAMAQVVVDLGTSGIQDNGTLMGTAALTADARFGSGAVHLPAGDENHVKLFQPVTDLDMDGSYTYMTWFRQVTPGQKGLIGLGNCCSVNGGDARNGYTMNITGTPAIRYWAGSTPNNSNHNLFTASTPAINDGAWHHVAIRVQPGQVDIFFDGALSVTNSESNIPTQPSRASVDALSTAVPKIGGDGISESSSATTIIDEVRVYGSALSDQAVVDAMNNTGALPDRLYYTFDDDTVIGSDDVARFKVTKTFSDGRADPVNVTLTCNTGLPLEQTFTINGGDPVGVTFVVKEFISGTMDCAVTETGSPAGYTVNYNGCEWAGITHGSQFNCVIGNIADPATFTVFKSWTILNDGGDAVDLTADVTIFCNNSIQGGGWNGDEYYLSDILVGETDSLTALVDTSQRAAECRAVEYLNQSGVESSDDCGTRTIEAGGTSSCSIINTVFFEAIPTLSQYGLAVLALLMLGMGLVGFRRFA